jgi:hypothetical protein
VPLERNYQAGLIRRIKKRFPGCVVLKNDPNYIQGIPDLTILYGPQWAVLEDKASENAPFRPNQEYYLELLGNMSAAGVIYPENEKEVLDELQLTFAAGWETCFPQRE